MDMTLDRAAAPARYALWLTWGGRAGFALLVLGFLAYACGFIAPHVPIEHLPGYWSRPASELLRGVGLSPGWGWAGLLHRGDMLALLAIAWLASCSIACLAAAIPVFAAARERAFAIICVAQIAVLALAASGFITVH